MAPAWTAAGSRTEAYRQGCGRVWAVDEQGLWTRRWGGCPSNCGAWSYDARQGRVLPYTFAQRLIARWADFARPLAAGVPAGVRPSVRGFVARVMSAVGCAPDVRCAGQQVGVSNRGKRARSDGARQEE